MECGDVMSDKIPTISILAESIKESVPRPYQKQILEWIEKFDGKIIYQNPRESPIVIGWKPVKRKS